MADVLYMIIPCYNEEEVLPSSAMVLRKKMNDLIERELISKESKVLFVNDGSKDRTWEIIKLLHDNDKMFTGISLAHNVGEQNAHVSGMITAREQGADMIVSMDADLQDDIDAIDEMIEKHYEGYEIIYGARRSRDVDSFFKKFTARAFYKIMKIIGTDLVEDHSQYRLMGRKALDAFARYSEDILFLPAVIKTLGFKEAVVYYDRKERLAGESKYPLMKMALLAKDAIFSMNYTPIHLLSVPAIIFLIVAIIGFIMAVVKNKTYLVLFGSIWLVGSAVMFGLRIIGEYTGKAYKEARRRPRFIVEEHLFD